MTAWVKSNTPGSALTPPRGQGELRHGALVALVVHALLFAALSFNIPWTPPPPTVVSAELWSQVQQSAPLPGATEPPPEPQPTPPAEVKPPAPVTPPVVQEAPPKPQVPDPQIAIEKEKKAQQERKERQERAEKEKTEKAAKAEQLRIEKEKAEKAQKDRADKLAKEKAEKAEAQKRAAAEEARLTKMREENLQRMMGQMGGGSPAGTGGTAAKEASYSNSYKGKIQAAIKANLIFNRSISGNPAVEIDIRVGPGGTIISQRIKTPSGNKEWDDAVLRAVERTGTLPRDVDGKVPEHLVVSYTPSDLMRP